MNSNAGQSAVGNVLNKLIRYTETHFNFEEDLFTKHGYEETNAHKDIHRKIVAKLLDLQR